jgi:hypothetical protein
MRFKPRSIVLVCTLVAVAIGAQASAASAATLFEWKVGGVKLKSGESKEVTLGITEPKAMVWHYGCCGVAMEATFSKVSVQSGAKLSGGKPGQFEGVLEFTGVKYNHKACEIAHEKLVTEPLVGEIVESAAEGKGTGKIELLLAPRNKNYWMVVEFASECVGAKTVDVSGSLLAEVQPQAKEEKKDKLVFDTTTAEYNTGGEYKTASGEFKRAGLVGGGPFYFDLFGEPEAELVSKEKFGAF